MLLIIPVGVQYAARRYPVVTFTLMGINTLVHIISMIVYWTNVGASVDVREWMVLNLGLIPDEKVWYTFLTAMFVHGDFFHLLGNMIYLYLFGACVEDAIGRWQFVLFYLFGGLVATLTYLIATPAGPQAAIPMVGASGAITACIGGFLLLLARTKINFRYILFFFFRFFSGDFWLPAWLIISFWFLKDLFWAVVAYNAPDALGGVAFAAHVGGFVGGLAIVGGWKLIPRRNVDEADEPATPGPIRVAVVARVKSDELPSVYLYENGTQLGPFTRDQITEMIALGSVGNDASYWREGMADWRSVTEFGSG